jgi:hypothetical protein
VRYLMAFIMFFVGTAAMAGPSPKQTRISRSVAESILAKSDALGQRISKQIMDVTGGGESALLSLQDSIEHSSQWRYYYRDRGILIAIPVKQQLSYMDRFDGEIEIARLAERLVLQSDNQRIEGAIRVVFIEPQPECRFRNSIHSAVHGSPSAAVTACGCH